jgi:putative tricarboxylic transport membrane protein
MPRLEARRIHPITVPGLVPGILSLVLLLLGVMLAVKSWRAPHAGGWRALLALLSTWQAARVGALVALVLVYTLGLVGWLPFWLASMLFVFSFIVVFEVALPAGPVDLRASLIWAVIVAIGAGLAISTVFERIFLVRLP